jgi:pyruvate oxidase
MAKYRCTVCNWVYDEAKEGVRFADLPAEWVCPVCGVSKTLFVLLAEKTEVFRKGRTVSEVLVDQVVEWGVRYFFGVPGTSTLGVVDAIRKNDKATYIQVRHEQTAAFMASAYGKLTGHIAAVLGVSGP